MNMRRAFSITRRIFQGLRHDRRTLGLALAAPIMVMLVFGTAFSGDVHDVKVTVVTGDEGFLIERGFAMSRGLDPDLLDFVTPVNDTWVRVNLADAIIAELEEGDVVIIEIMDDEDDALEEVEQGRAWGMMHFPQGFTRDVFLNETEIGLRLDESSVNVAGAIKKELGEAIQRVMDDIGTSLPLEIDDSEPIYGDNATFIDFFVPGIMALAVYMLTTLLTLLSFVGEKSTGTLERLQASPLTEGEIVVGYAMAFGCLGTVQAGLLMAVAIIVFGITIVGNPLIAFLVVAVLAVVSQNLGILLSSAAKTEAQAVQMIPVIILPTFLLAGIFWPLEAIPQWLRPVSYIIPPTYAVEALRSVLLRGWGIERIIWPQLVALLLFAVFFLTAAVGLLRSRKK
jgi:ABC-2 type transport system permease protein